MADTLSDEELIAWGRHYRMSPEITPTAYDLIEELTTRLATLSARVRELSDKITISRECAQYALRATRRDREGWDFPARPGPMERELEAALSAQDDGWVRVDEGHPLPHDLKENDELMALVNEGVLGTRYPVITAYRRRPTLRTEEG